MSSNRSVSRSERARERARELAKEQAKERAKERTKQITAFLGRMPIEGAPLQVVRNLQRLGFKIEVAEELAASFDRSFWWYTVALRSESLRGRQDREARKAHKLAKTALRLLERHQPRLSEYNATVHALLKTFQVLNTLKRTGASSYVSPLMRYGITEHTVRMATGLPPPPCDRPRCSKRDTQCFCRCKIWPEGTACTIDAFAEFDYPSVPLASTWDPRAHNWTGATGLLRLYIARFDPAARPAKKGPPEPPYDQELMDDLCCDYEEITEKRARYYISIWRRVLATVLEAYSLQFLDTDNRIKRYESYIADQRKRYGHVFLPRGVGDPWTQPRSPRKRVLTKSTLAREKLLKSQLARRKLEYELFVGGT